MAAEQRPGGLRRLLRLWQVYAYLDFMFMTRDLRSFVTYAVSDTILYVASVTATLLLAERFEGIGAWTKAQVLFMLGYAVIAGGLQDLLFGYNVKFISRRIGRGQLDHLLVQPQPLWQALLTEGFLPFSAGAVLVPGLVLLGWALAALPPPASPAWLAALLANLVASAAIGLAFSCFWSSLAFWAPSAAEEVSSSANRLLSRLTPFPLDGLGQPLLAGLLTVVPAGFLAWYPSRALLGLDPAPYAVAVTPLAALLLSALAAWLFTRGLREYGRTGSTRYSAFGHRR
jgi:ABC-2 type transport system permease protein